jgi:hypothetical protein
MRPQNIKVRRKIDVWGGLVKTGLSLYHPARGSGTKMRCFIASYLPWVGVLLSAATLGVVAYYTALTKRIAEAAQDQVESTRRPVVTLDNAPRWTDAVKDLFEQIETQLPVGAQAAAQEDDRLVLKNIGSGPALNIDYKFFPLGTSPSARGERVYLRSLAFLEPGEKITTPLHLTYANQSDIEFVAEYESLSRRRYKTRIVLKKRVFDSFEVYSL